MFLYDSKKRELGRRVHAATTRIIKATFHYNTIPQNFLRNKPFNVVEFCKIKPPYSFTGLPFGEFLPYPILGLLSNSVVKSELKRCWHN